MSPVIPPSLQPRTEYFSRLSVCQLNLLRLQSFLKQIFFNFNDLEKF